MCIDDADNRVDDADNRVDDADNPVCKILRSVVIRFTKENIRSTVTEVWRIVSKILKSLFQFF